MTNDNKLIINRVVYGKADTPEELREYVIAGVAPCPVGTLKDWQEYAKNQGFDGVVIANLGKC